jgi:hypothetical protein
MGWNNNIHGCGYAPSAHLRANFCDTFLCDYSFAINNLVLGMLLVNQMKVAWREGSTYLCKVSEVNCCVIPCWEENFY